MEERNEIVSNSHPYSIVRVLAQRERERERHTLEVISQSFRMRVSIGDEYCAKNSPRACGALEPSTLEILVHVKSNV